MKFTLEIDMDNAAFDSPNELARIVKDIGCQMEGCNSNDGDDGMVRDVNGNTVGHWDISGERAVDAETPVWYYVQDREGENVAFYQVQEEHGADSARTDAKRQCDAMNEEALEDLSDTDKALAKFNDTPYVLAVEFKDGTITTEGA